MQTYSFFSRVPNFFSYFFMKPINLPKVISNYGNYTRTKIVFAEISAICHQTALIFLYFKTFLLVADSKNIGLSVTFFTLSYTYKAHFCLFFVKKVPENVAIFAIFLYLCNQ